jgi:hypothetical protein
VFWKSLYERTVIREYETAEQPLKRKEVMSISIRTRRCAVTVNDWFQVPESGQDQYKENQTGKKEV